jgi:hypothetical protein
LIPAILDRFSIQGPNGTHSCFVTAPARCSLSDAKQGSARRLFQLDVARSLAAQLALAVAHVHEHGLVHGGQQLSPTQRWVIRRCSRLLDRPSPGQHPPPAAVRPRRALGERALRQSMENPNRKLWFGQTELR